MSSVCEALLLYIFALTVSTSDLLLRGTGRESSGSKFASRALFSDAAHTTCVRMCDFVCDPVIR